MIAGRVRWKASELPGSVSLKLTPAAEAVR